MAGLSGLELFVIIAVIMIVFILIAVIAFALSRKRKAVKMVIIRDYRKSASMQKPQSYYLVVDSGQGIKKGLVYKSLVSFWKAMPDVWEMPDLNGINWAGTVFAEIGNSGNQNDNNLRFIPLPLTNRIGADEYVHKQADELVRVLNLSIKDMPKEYKDKLQQTINKNITSDWVSKYFGLREITKNDIIPRDFQVAWVSNMKIIMDFHKAHESPLDKIMKYMAIIFIAILIVGFGIGMYLLTTGFNSFLTTLSQVQQTQQTWFQAANLQIGKSLAAVGVYGYNALVPAYTTTIPPSGGGTPSLPNLPTTH